MVITVMIFLYSVSTIWHFPITWYFLKVLLCFLCFNYVSAIFILGIIMVFNILKCQARLATYNIDQINLIEHHGI